MIRDRIDIELDKYLDETDPDYEDPAELRRKREEHAADMEENFYLDE